jgi:hypothetical protein
VTTVVTQVAESFLGIVGIRAGTEEPSHSSERLGEGIEIRRYQSRIAEETTVQADEEQARSEGFRRLGRLHLRRESRLQPDRHDRAGEPGGYRWQQDCDDRTGLAIR